MIDKVILDYKLIHRRTVESWCKEEGISEIILVSEEAKSDYIERTRIEMSVPRQINLLFLDVEVFMDVYKSNQDLSSTLIIFKESKELANFIRRGGKVEEIKVQSLKSIENKETYNENIIFSEEEEKDLRMFVSMGIDVEINIIQPI